MKKIVCEMSELLKITLSVDENFLKTKLSSMQLELDQHERQIKELYDLLSRKSDKTDLDRLRSDMERQYNDKLSTLENAFDSKLKNLENNLTELIRNQIGGLRDNTEISERLRAVETTAMQSTKDILENKNYLQTMVQSYSHINNTNATLDHQLPAILGATTNHVVAQLNQINSLTDEIANLKSQLEDEIDRNKNRSDEPVIQERSVPIQPREPSEPATIIHHTTTGTEIDLTTLHPREVTPKSWRDRPKIPMPTKFDKIEEVVDYIYQAMPHIQGNLDAMHNKILEDSAALEGQMDKDMLNQLLAKLREAIRQMNQDLHQLRSNLGDGLTRDEIFDMIEASQKQSEGAIGSVRCIACGRDMTQVSGAMRESDAVKRLGTPVNALVIDGQSGQLYSNTQGMERGICESPRSLRPFRASVSVTKKHRPRPPQ